MKTDLHPRYANRPEGAEAKALISACVHCGFCNAACPTYQELSDERDGPRGRIYLIRQLLETGKASYKTRLHLDRCLTCRACETACPSGVEYGRLVEIGRSLVEEKPGVRDWRSALARRALRLVLPYPSRHTILLHLGQCFKALLPLKLRSMVPVRQARLVWPHPDHARRMIVLRGCVQASATPRTNAAAAQVLDRLGITLIEAPKAGCCGAASHHLSGADEALNFARANINAWWPEIEAGAEAIVMTASGCGCMVKDYHTLLSRDPNYAEKALRVSKLARDLSEILLTEGPAKLPRLSDSPAVAVHCPCSLQHGQRQPDAIEKIMQAIGANLVPTQEKQLCCGSAGAYSILQPELSQRLLNRKLRALTAAGPAMIVTANVGCQLHLARAAEVPLRHWIELVLDAFEQSGQRGSA